MGWWDLDEHTRPWYQKYGVEAMDFVADLSLPRRLTTAIVHTRNGSGTTPLDNDNNHPVIAEGIVLVHNGVVSNDAEILKELGQEDSPGDVDSKAFAYLLAFGPEVFQQYRPEKLLEKIEGWGAIAWLDSSHPDRLYLARHSTAPLHVAETRGGDLIFASTYAHVEAAADLCGIRMLEGEDVAEGTLLEVVGGEIVAIESFEPPKKVKYTGSTACPPVVLRSSTTPVVTYTFPQDAPEGTTYRSPTGRLWVKRKAGWTENKEESNVEYTTYTNGENSFQAPDTPQQREALGNLGWTVEGEVSDRMRDAVATFGQQPLRELEKPVDPHPATCRCYACLDEALGIHDEWCECFACQGERHDYDPTCACASCLETYLRMAEMAELKRG